MDQSGNVLWRKPRRIAVEESAEGKAIVAMTLERIEGALGLPEGVRLAAIRVDVMCGVVEFRFGGRGLPVVAEGAALMYFESLREAWEYRAEVDK